MMPWSFAENLPRSGAWSVEESERYCMRTAALHYENFPVVTHVLDDGVRRSLGAVYAFARTADDFADEPQDEGVRLDLLDLWEEQLGECFAGRARHPVFIALGSAVRRHGLQQEALAGLLSAFRQDCLKQRYVTMDDVLDYCSRSANPVGRLVLRIMGQESDDALELADRTCTALQLANFWQDLSVDIPRGRLYVPLDRAASWGIDEADLMARRIPRGLGGLLRELVDETRTLMVSARSLPRQVRLPGGFYLEAVQRGGLGILTCVERLGVDVLHRRPRLRRRDAASILVRTSASTLSGAPRRLASAALGGA